MSKKRMKMTISACGVLLDTHLSDFNLPKDCPFTFLHLSSEDSPRDESLDDLTRVRTVRVLPETRSFSHACASRTSFGQ